MPANGSVFTIHTTLTPGTGGPLMSKGKTLTIGASLLAGSVNTGASAGGAVITSSVLLVPGFAGVNLPVEKIYFAWIDASEEFSPAVHVREDEDVFALDWEHSEGDFAGLRVVIKNPRIGLLHTSRKTWAVLSFRDGNVVTPFFKGRLIGIPTNVFDTLVTLDFTAKPVDYEAQKAALANSLKVLPYWDPIFISPDNWADPDAVLEAYSRLWYIDPVTLKLTTSDILIPEDGAVEILETDHFYDDMQLTLNQTPLRSVAMVATIPWSQTADGGLDLTPLIKELFGTPIPTSYTMTGLASSWPKGGSGFGSGWEVLEGSMTDVSYAIPKMTIPDIFNWQGEVPVIPEGSVIFPLKVTGEYHSGEKAGFNFNYELVIAQLGYGVPDLRVTYAAGREFGQVVTFTLETDQQDIVTLPGEDERMVITLNANKVSDPTEDLSIPIGDVRKRDYVYSERGMLSIEHLLLIARAHLIARSRAVEISIKTDWKTGMRLRSLRKGMLLHDHRLPGGEATGKIIKAALSLNGDDGAATAEITIACCVGKGGSHTASTGTPTYVDEGYMDDTQEYSGQIQITDTEDIAWGYPTPVTFDDKLDFIKGLNVKNAVKLASIINPASVQEPLIRAAGDGPNTDQAKVSSVLQQIPTQISIQMVPMEGGPFQNEVVISVSDLVIPKQIDLEAPSNA